MSQTAMNFEDLISGDVVLRYYCICCLEHNGPFIRIGKCVHSGFLKKFPLPDFNPSIPEVVCLKCHNTLRKINNFEKQVQESYSILLEKAHFQNKIYTKSNLTISKVEHLDISENEIPQTYTPNMPFKNTKNIETALNIVNTNANSLQSTHLKSFSDPILVLANKHLNLEPTRNTVLPATSNTNLLGACHSSKRKAGEIKDFMVEKRKNLITTANIVDKTNSVDNKTDLVTDKIGVNGLELLEIKEELITDDLNVNEDEIINNKYEIKPLENNYEIDIDVKINTTVDEDTTLINSTKIHKKVTNNNSEVKTEIDSLNNEIVIPMDIKIENEEEVVIDHVYGTNVLSKDIKMEPDEYETDRAESLERNEAPNDFTMDDSAPITSQTINYKELQEERENKLKSKEFLKWPHRCDSCIIGFQFKDNLDDHYKRKHEMREGLVSCKIGRQAVDVDNIDDHNSIGANVETSVMLDQRYSTCGQPGYCGWPTKIYYIESTKASATEEQTITSRRKTNAQKCREYRERKKLQNTMVPNITAKRPDECSETDQLQAKRPKTNAERRKKHYEAQKLKKQGCKKIPKTAKQRNKEYYERKKQNRALNALNHHLDASRDNCNAKICKHPEEIRNNAEETQNNSFHVPYQQFRNCAQPQGIYYQDVDIHSDGNIFGNNDSETFTN